MIFGQTKDNVVVDCTSNRLEEAVLSNDNTDASVTEVSNADHVSFTNVIDTDIFLSDSFRTLAVVSADNHFYEIPYTLRLSTETRTGRLRIMVNDTKTSVTLADESNYSATSSTSPAGQLMTGFLFDVAIADNDADSGNDTVILSYKNPIATGSTGSIAFGISYGV